MFLEFSLGVLKELDSKGVSWGMVLTALLLWSKLIRNKEFKERDERVERNQKRIMIHLGVEDGEWSTPRKTLMKTALLSLRKWYFSLQVDINQVFQSRRGSKMKISKVWLSGVIAYLLGQLAIKYGFTFNDAMADTAADFIITFAIPVIIAFLNRTKPLKEAAAIAQKSKDYGPTSFQ